MMGQRVTAQMVTLLGYLLILAAPVSALTIEDFTRDSTLRNVKISPDGRHLAMLRREAKDTIFIIRSTDMSVATGVNSSPNQRFVDFTWANDNRLLIEPALESPEFSEPISTGEILGFSLDGRHNGFVRRNIAGDGRVRMYSLVSVLPNDADHVLYAEYTFEGAGPGRYAQPFRDLALAETVLPMAPVDGILLADGGRCTQGKCARSGTPRLYRLNVYTGAAELIAEAPLARAQFVADARSSAVLATGETEDRQVGVFAFRDGAWSKVAEIERGMGVVPIAFKRADRAWVLDNRVDTVGLSELNLATGEIQHHFSDRVSDVDRIIHDHGGLTLLALRYTPGYPSWHYLEPEGPFARTHKSLRTAFPQSDVDITSVTADNVQMIARVYSDRNPGDYYLVNTNTKDTQFLVTRRQSIEPDALAASSPIQVETRDRFTIHGFLTMPASGRSDPPPLVVMVHDQPFAARFAWEYDEDVQLLAEHGYAVLQINPRGSAGYGRRYRSGTDEELNDAMQRDVVDATRWVVTQERADQNRICLYGRGFGAYSAMMALTADRQLFSCIIGYGGLYDLQQPFERRDVTSVAAAAYLRDRTLQNTPWSQSPIDVIDDIAVPVMLAHGGRDTIVPISQAEGMLAALQAGNRTVSRTFQPNAPHRFTDPAHRNALYQDMLSFLAAHAERASLPTRGTRPAPLNELLSAKQAADLQKVLDDILAHVGRMTRTRDDRKLATGLVRRDQDTSRVVRQAVDAHDRDARKVLSESQWPAYESIKDRYAQQLEEALSEKRELPRFVIRTQAS
ncbi:MAG: S9 family peptidase [Gammaproteobacteria bacterium]|nr:S9 family peptidase [Gammaproteobacteria bacterium]